MKIDYFLIETEQLESSDREIADLLSLLNHYLLKHSIKQTQIVRFTVFYNQAAANNFPELLLKSIKEHFNYAIPAISLLAQPPLGKGNLMAEVSYVSNSKAIVEYKKHKNVFYTLASLNNQHHIFISGLQSVDTKKSIKDQSEDAFQLLEFILAREGYTFTNIIRQWNYIQGIIDEKDGDQNYQTFNDVRTKYYDKNGLISNYPAATGIGIKEGGVIIEVHALKPSGELKLAEICNPLQIDAYAYSEKVLEGRPIAGFKKKSTPKFSRAKWVGGLNSAQILVSGTASIHGEETIGLNDVEKQTHLTIKNIHQLTDKEHLLRLNLDCKKAPQQILNVRVYVKNSNDIDAVRRVCGEYFSTSNIAFVEADICRSNLLVEIECCVSFSM